MSTGTWKLPHPPNDIPYLLDIVVRECASILQLLSGEDQSLLVRGNAFLVLDLRLHIVDSVRRLNLEGYSLTSKGLDKAGVQQSVFKVAVTLSIPCKTHICTNNAGKVSRALRYGYKIKQQMFQLTGCDLLSRC